MSRKLIFSMDYNWSYVSDHGVYQETETLPATSFNPVIGHKIMALTTCR